MTNIMFTIDTARQHVFNYLLWKYMQSSLEVINYMKPAHVLGLEYIFLLYLIFPVVLIASGYSYTC